MSGSGIELNVSELLAVRLALHDPRRGVLRPCRRGGHHLHPELAEMAGAEEPEESEPFGGGRTSGRGGEGGVGLLPRHLSAGEKCFS